MINSAIYQYYPIRDQCLSCIVCGYLYRLDAPLSTLQKHLRVKHDFSIRNPLSPHSLQRAIEDAQLVPRSLKHRFLSASQGNSKKASLEEALINWFSSEGYSTQILNQPSFRNLFYAIDPTLILPSHERLVDLLNFRLNRVVDDSNRAFQLPSFSISFLPQAEDETSCQELPLNSKHNAPNHTSFQQLLYPARQNLPFDH